MLTLLLIQALINDLLDMKLNRVTIDLPDKDGNIVYYITDYISIVLYFPTETSIISINNTIYKHMYKLVFTNYIQGKSGAENKSGANSKRKTYDLNTQADSFLHSYAGCPFPEAVDANEKELGEVSIE